MKLCGDSLRDTARREALELIDELLTKAMVERQYGRLEVVYQDGVVNCVRADKVFKIGQPTAGRTAA